MTTENELKAYLLRQWMEEQNSLCVIYNPDCGCKIDQFVILDRYPMSKEIICACPECKKGCLMKISKPIRFHLPLTSQDFSLKELKKLVVPAGRQEEFIKSYQTNRKTSSVLRSHYPDFQTKRSPSLQKRKDT